MVKLRLPVPSAPSPCVIGFYVGELAVICHVVYL